MRVWDIKVLYYGRMTMPFSTMLSVIYAWGAPQIAEDFVVSVPYLGFLFQSEGHNIVLDTGVSEAFIVGGKAWAGLHAEGGKSYVEKALASENVSPTDVGTVIYTHLHNDHAGNCSLFSKANHIFQRDEWQNLLEPLPIQLVNRDYDPETVKELRAVSCLRVDGDFELIDGIRVYKTPGHTRGSQSVAVNTPKGVVVLVGDLLLSNISAFPYVTEITDMEGVRHGIPPAPAAFGDAVPSRITYDFHSFYDSVNKMRAVASRNEPGYIIPGHETSLVISGI